MTEPAPLPTDKLLQAQHVLASMGVSTADFIAGITNGLPILAAAADPREDTVHRCTHADGCDNDATHQTTRPATPEEAEAHWTALEQNIRSKNDGHPAADYVADRTDTVTIAVHLCDDPDHADPAHLEGIEHQRRTEEEAAAKARRDNDA